MENFLARTRAALDAQPFTRLLGASLASMDGKSIELSLPLRDDLKQQHGFAHGGVLSYLADNALTIAGAMGLGKGVLTSEFKINFLRPATGSSLLARASVVHAGKRQAVCRCDVFARDGDAEKLVATAQGTIVAVDDLPDAKA
ncbi:PaaI family thioesterase [Noviherbaspirillum galbum]|uniref:Medium/long-chain acyl-CoA thioesterase YigI n=1 Tax=Noviherbaspirillum galbum TaxID=2709383 RepID=A0A6B3SMM6_9BURK|nr:PaaI family thioesterase [Noviherbaspirillum galbum]NEX62104.1 PaaI family thioesterase [Noviherbaspirillum galbum]